MTRYRLLSAAIVLSTSAAAVQAGPGCMNNRQATGWYSPQAMYGYPQQMMPRPGSMGHAQMSAYARPHNGMAMSQYRQMPHYSPMMAGARQQDYYRPAASMQQQPSAATSAGNNTPQDEASGDSVTVRIKGMSFEPARITVTPGTTVTWIQEDGYPHTVTGSSGELASDTMMSGQRFTHTFDEAGSYDYACNFHPMMKGQVVVDDNAS